jgi:hypothetical protein
MPGFSLAGQRRWATKRHHHYYHHHHHPLLIFPVEAKANESGIFYNPNTCGDLPT